MALAEKFRVQRIVKSVGMAGFVSKKRGGSDVAYQDVDYPVFVLRIDGKDPAAIEALRTYALATTDDGLAAELAAIAENPKHKVYLEDIVHEVRHQERDA